jgi:hypothetical protein
VEDDWRSVARKSEKWLEDELLRADPRIESRSLMDWADQFINNLKLASFQPAQTGHKRKKSRDSGIRDSLRRT